jgi:lysylphosphatidylglycerol synthetase-like protein (DUF2156 family)
LASSRRRIFLASIAGIGLLLLSQGLARRLDVAYFLDVSALIAGGYRRIFLK